jgi:hypothetical protein
MTNIGHDWASSSLELMLRFLHRRADMLMLVYSLVLQRVFDGKHSFLLEDWRDKEP